MPLAFLMGVSVPVKMLLAGPPRPPIVKGSTVAEPPVDPAPAAAADPLDTELVVTLDATLGTACMLATPCGVIVGPLPAVDSLPIGFNCVMVSEG